MLDGHSGVIVFLLGIEASYWMVWFLSKKFKVFAKMLSFLNKPVGSSKSKSFLENNVSIPKDTSGDLLSFLSSTDDMHYSSAYSDFPVNVHYKFPE